MDGGGGSDGGGDGGFSADVADAVAILDGADGVAEPSAQPERASAIEEPRGRYRKEEVKPFLKRYNWLGYFLSLTMVLGAWKVVELLYQAGRWMISSFHG